MAKADIAGQENRRRPSWKDRRQISALQLTAISEVTLVAALAMSAATASGLET